MTGQMLDDLGGAPAAHEFGNVVWRNRRGENVIPVPARRRRAVGRRCRGSPARRPASPEIDEHVVTGQPPACFAQIVTVGGTGQRRWEPPGPCLCRARFTFVRGRAATRRRASRSSCRNPSASPIQGSMASRPSLALTANRSHVANRPRSYNTTRSQCRPRHRRKSTQSRKSWGIVAHSVRGAVDRRQPHQEPVHRIQCQAIGQHRRRTRARGHHGPLHPQRGVRHRHRDAIRPQRTRRRHQPNRVRRGRSTRACR